jgi:hypothetical protein
MSPATLAVAVFFLFAPSPATAFSTSEHEWISNRAFCMAERMAPPLSAEKREVLRVIREESDACGKTRVTANYGQLVAFADFSKRPEEAMTFRGKGVDRINYCQMEDNRTVLFRAMREVLVNEHHFGLSALREFHNKHQVAIERAAGGTPEDLLDALVLNAYADHLLEDTLAPGHMTETAGDKSHMENLRLHERDNERGRNFELNRGFWKTYAAALQGSGRLEEVLRCFHSGEEPVRDWIRALVIHSKPDEPEHKPSYTPIRMEGDGDLLDDDIVEPDTVPQAGIMVLLVARSVLDVLEASSKDETKNTFENRSCTADTDGQGACYFVEPGKQLFAGFSAGAYRDEHLNTAEKTWFPVLGMFAEMQRIKGTSRVQFSGETIIAIDWKPPGWLPWRLDDFRLEVAGGYSAVTRASGHGGHGPDLRLYLRNKGIHTFIALDLGYRYYSGDGEEARGMKIGGRIGFGNGLFWGFAGVARDLMIEDGRSSSDNTVWSLGVAATLAPTVLGRPFD